MSGFKFHPPVKKPYGAEQVLEELKEVRYRHKTQHVACNRWWYDAMHAVSKPKTFPTYSYFGYPVFITDDVESPLGYELRPGNFPGEEK